MASRPLRVGIVGCGSAGPAAALLLARAGHEVRIFEQTRALEPVGTGFLLQPTGLQVLERLDLREAVEHHGARVARLLSRTRSGRVLLDLQYARLAADAHGLGMHRATLLHFLVEALATERVRVECGVQVSATELEGERRWVHADGERHGPFDLVVLANGARSPLRSEVGGSQRARRYPWGALWTIAPDVERRFAGRLYQIVEGTHTMLGFLDTGTRVDDPDRTPLVSVFWSVHGDRVEETRRAGHHALADAILGLAPEAARVLDHVDAMERWSHAAYLDVVMARWHGEACVALGDAAHAMSPQLGQGVNLALWDAWVLARCIEREEHLGRALARYTAERRHHLAFYQRATRWLTPLFQSSIPGAALLRNLAFPLMARVPVLERQMLRSMAGLKTGLLRSDLRAGGW
ncbi:MAG: NAD(P)/FAD-dependent oxidoreductase [Myxococcota bacterium]|nr:NAD(P)/FAD-dependent oxidoreductase [Myxococcota bacterium]